MRCRFPEYAVRRGWPVDGCAYEAVEDMPYCVEHLHSIAWESVDRRPLVITGQAMLLLAAILFVCCSPTCPAPQRQAIAGAR